MKTIKLLFLSLIITMSLTNCGTPQSKAEKVVKTYVESKALVPVTFEFGVIDTAKIVFSQTKDCVGFNKSIDSLMDISSKLTTNYIELTQKYLKDLDNENKLLETIKIYEDTTKKIDSQQKLITDQINGFKLKVKELDLNTKPIDGYKLIVYQTIEEPKAKLKLIYYFDKDFNVIDSKIPSFDNAIKEALK